MFQFSKKLEQTRFKENNSLKFDLKTGEEGGGRGSGSSFFISIIFYTTPTNLTNYYLLKK